jgi:hypothetical protein
MLVGPPHLPGCETAGWQVVSAQHLFQGPYLQLSLSEANPSLALV